MAVRCRKLRVHSQCRLPITLMALQVLFCAPVFSAEWSTDAGVESEVIVQRISGTSGVDDRETETLLGLSPYFSINGKGRSININARLGIDAVYDVSDGSSSTRPSAAIDSLYTVVPERATVAVFASADRVLESRSRSADEFLSEANEDRSQFDFSITSSANRRFGQASALNVEHNFLYTDFSDNEELSSQSHSVRADTLSVLQRGRAFLTTNTNYLTTTIDDTGSFEFGEAIVGLGVPLNSQKTLASVLVGHDLVDVQGSEEDLDGFFWGVNLRWEPNDRLLLSAGYTRRNFGQTPFLLATWSGRRNSLSFQWSRQSGLQQGLFSNSGFATSLTPGDGQEASPQLTDPDADPALVGGQSSVSPLVDDVQSIDERLELTHTLEGRVSSFTTTLGVNTRSSILSADSTESTLRFASFEFQRAFGRSISATISYRTATSDNNIGTDDSRSDRFRISVLWVYL